MSQGFCERLCLYQGNIALVIIGFLKSSYYVVFVGVYAQIPMMKIETGIMDTVL